MNEKQSGNGNRTYIVNHPVDDQPKHITEEQIKQIRFILETPIETDEDYEELGRDCRDD
jgi:hypothetical protein